MSAIPDDRISIPKSLQNQLKRFRWHVWSTKLTELASMAVVGTVVAVGAMFVIDRFFDTPDSIRWLIFASILVVATLIPWAVYRWVWRNRRFDQIARLLRRRDPNMGDQLLGAIELSDADGEVARSPALCRAALNQVTETAATRDLNQAAPLSRYKIWALGAVGCAILVAMAGMALPDAAKNALARAVFPWSDTPRYTFTQLEELPESKIVPHGEYFSLKTTLSQESRWQPNTANLSIPGLESITADRSNRDYEFEVPPVVESTLVRLKTGDAFHSISIEPKTRPQIEDISATISLPSYLQIEEPIQQDLRGGLLSAVAGSSAAITANATRQLDRVAITSQFIPEIETAPELNSESNLDRNGVEILDLTLADSDLPPVEQVASTISIASIKVSDFELRDGETEAKISLTDSYGLESDQPFRLSMRGVKDQSPSITTQEFPRQAVLLVSEQLNFPVFIADDFGVKVAGFSWIGLDPDLPNRASGEQVLVSGNPTLAAKQIPATFCAEKLGIAPQPIQVRFWIEDFKPDRERIYSPPHTFYVLSADQHAIYMTEQLSKWHRQALNIRDNELQLYAKNKEFRNMTVEELNTPEMRKELQRQSNNERTNGRRLANLNNNGRNLLQQAARNPEIGVGHLDKWAEMLKTLDDISSNRMPSVADLLSQSSKAKPSAGSESNKKRGPSAGKNRNQIAGNGKPSKSDDEKPKQPLPSISDMESSMQPNSEQLADEKETGKPKKNGGKFSLPNTTLVGPPKKTKPPADAPADESADAAVYEQEDLLAEFQKIADELNEVLANLEGSTLVKRLKAESRNQNTVADKISNQIAASFGASRQPVEVTKSNQRLSESQDKSASRVSNIMDDVEAYFERRRMQKFKLVLDDMREKNVISAIRQFGDDLSKEQGLSIAQAEYWADAMDRWAEDLVDPARGGQCPGCKSSDALPPSLVLECLQILEAEVNLRENTRVAEQAREAVSVNKFNENAAALEADQDILTDRVSDVIDKIVELEDGESRFGKEINLLNQVRLVMADATAILSEPDTGKRAIAAETEAIELLLQSKRINPNAGGGGGGASPGGGGKGDTKTPALALAGRGVNAKEQREPRDVAQTTGETKSSLPEEFRGGLDEYFNRLDVLMNE